MAAAAVVTAAAALRLADLTHAPPGLHFDEAVYGMMARDIVEGARPVFFSAYTGREPLYMYLMAPFVAVLGSTAWAVRLTSAMVGILTVAATFAVGSSLLGRRVGLAAAALLATMYWHVTVSRNGYPNVLIPPIAALSAYALWRAWRRVDRVRLWAAGGALAGLILYTYLAARLWPVALVAMLAWAAAVEPRGAARRARGIAVAAVAAAVVAAPLGWHFARHPADFVERANQVLAWRQLEGSALVAAYAHNVVETAAGLVLRGDPRWHYNLPGRPVLVGLAAPAFLLGLAVALRGARDLRRAVPVWWLAVMCVPGVLTLEMQPAGQRIFGITPAVAVLAALGLVAFAEGLRHLLRRRAGAAVAGAVAAAVAVAVVASDGVRTARDYFGDWARRPETYHIFNADYARMAEAARRDVASGRDRVAIMSEHHRHATVAFLAPETIDGAVWVAGSSCVVVPAGDRPLIVYAPASYVGSDTPAGRWLAARAGRAEVLPGAPPPAVPDGRPIELHVTRYEIAPTAGRATGAPVVPAAHAPASDAGPAASPAGGDGPTGGAPGGGPEPERLGAPAAVVGGEVEILRLGRPVVGERDEPVEVPVDWRVLVEPSGGRGFALHLRDADGLEWGQADGTCYVSDQWRAGDVVRQWFELPKDPTRPPGAYEAHVVVVDEAGRALPAAGARGTAGSVPVGEVRLLPRGERRAPPDLEPVARLGDLAILSVDPLPAAAEAGGAVDVGILWMRDGPAPTSAATFLLDGRAVTERPIAAGHPPSRWEDREELHGRYRIRLPEWSTAGDHELSVTAPGVAPVPLGRVAVPDVARAFDVPPGARSVVAERGPSASGEASTSGGAPADGGTPATGGAPAPGARPVASERGAAFDDGLSLDAWRLDGRIVPGGTVTVTLYWRVREPQVDAVDAAAFVHLVGPDGAILSQHDGPPGGGTPLGARLPGEVVADAHRLDLPAALPADGLGLAVGLYDRRTGERRGVTTADGLRPAGRSVSLALDAADRG